ncbi:MAG: LacI family DNA-binding transcriptional regulator [Candidatus Methylacidiphilales bacterium]|nr:LacI family DNA-binding transcriptional regulator [Candidatus Methylacidiphilales bacterium]
MSETDSPVTLKMIAQVAGVTHPTVSRALRNDSRNISEATCKRIQEIARSLGYRPDPAMSALIAHRTRVRHQGEYNKIVVLNAWGTQPLPPYFQEQLHGMTTKAAALGYQIDLLPVPVDTSAQAHLSRTLVSRGIRGIIVGPLPVSRPHVQLEWKHFSAVTTGYSLASPSLPYVASNHLQSIETIYEQLRLLGYRKIGFFHHRDSERRNRHLYLASYLKCLVLDGMTHDEAPPLLTSDAHNPNPLDWITRHGFEAVICGWHESQHLMSNMESKGLRVPDDLGIASFGISHDTLTKMSGLAEDWVNIGTEAVALLQSLILAGKRGLPEQRTAILIDGKWKQGETVRGETISTAVAPSKKEDSCAAAWIEAPEPLAERS